MKQFLLIFGIILGLIVMLISTILAQLYFNDIIWFSVGIGIILISFLLNRYSSNHETRELARKEEERLAKLITDGVKVVVDLSRCEMKSSSHHAQKKGLDYLDETEAIDIIFNSGENAKPETIIHTVLVYKHRLESGKLIQFHGPTLKDKRTLEFLCTMQKHTTLYFDRNDPKVYYFDLKFLD